MIFAKTYQNHFFVWHHQNAVRFFRYQHCFGDWMIKDKLHLLFIYLTKFQLLTKGFHRFRYFWCAVTVKQISIFFHVVPYCPSVVVKTKLDRCCNSIYTKKKKKKYHKKEPLLNGVIKTIIRFVHCSALVRCKNV